MQIFDSIPILGMFALSFVVIMLAMECGFRLGVFLAKRQPEKKAAVGDMIQPTLGLLAFILAFTFGTAASHFGDRRISIINEANAIGTTFLRADFLPETNRKEVQDILRDYVAIRLKLSEDLKTSSNPSELTARAVADSEKLQDRLWTHAKATGSAHPESIVVGLFIESLNETIELQTKRVFVSSARISDAIWMDLYALVILGMIGIGYRFGREDKRTIIGAAIVAVSFSTVVMMIADLDRPQGGLIHTSKQPLIDLAKRMGPPSSAAAPTVH